jgi:hypothetical protein
MNSKISNHIGKEKSYHTLGHLYCLTGINNSPKEQPQRPPDTSHTSYAHTHCNLHPLHCCNGSSLRASACVISMREKKARSKTYMKWEVVDLGATVPGAFD